MCWQCITPPWKYLPGAKLIKIDGHSDYASALLEWEGTWKTNPKADWLVAGEALPGDVDAEGVPYFTKE